MRRDYRLVTVITVSHPNSYQSYSWSAEQVKLIFPCPRSRLRIWSPETGSAVPSRVSLLILHTPAEYGAYSRDFSRFPWQSRVYQFTQQLRTDGVLNCRDSADRGPVVLKVVAVTTGAPFSGCIIDHLYFAEPLFRHSITTTVAVVV